MFYSNGKATMFRMYRNCTCALLVIACMFAVSTPAFSQEIMLDEMVEAGGLKMFPVYGDATTFYYLPDKVTIPNGADGKPQFSFLKFARNEAGDGEGGVQKGQGGGLVSFLVSFELSDSARRNAEGELQSKVPGATLVGPLNYKSGTFTLVSNFQQEGGDWTDRVVGLGKAPVMEGHKAAVSIRLTAEGATILWESFKQAASDISVSFEMVIAGYRSPYEAKMTAHWDKIASNRTMAAGLKTAWLGVDVQDTLKQLKEEGAIEVKAKGTDEQMEKLWAISYGMLAKQMFEPDNDPATLATLQDDPNLYSNFDKANAFNKEERERVDGLNKSTSTLPSSDSTNREVGVGELAFEHPMPEWRDLLLNGVLLAMNDQPLMESPFSDFGQMDAMFMLAANDQPVDSEDELLKKRDALFEMRKRIKDYEDVKEQGGDFWEVGEDLWEWLKEIYPDGSMDSEEQVCEEVYKEVYSTCNLEDWCQKIAQACGQGESFNTTDNNNVAESAKPEQKPKSNFFNKKRNPKPAKKNKAEPKPVENENATTQENIDEARRKDKERAANMRGEDGKLKPQTPEAKAQNQKAIDSAKQVLDATKAQPGKPNAQAPTPDKPVPAMEIAKKKIAKIETPPSFALMASYRKKTFKKSGKYELTFTRAFLDTQAMRFDENIGGFGKAMLNDKAHFRIINLDDPAYDQREILVQLDGQDAEDFDQFVNFVTVSMRKKHQDGSTTVQELKIDKSNFMHSSNNFRMVYGNKGDSDRDQWLGFDYRIVWSLHGGLVHDSGWQEYTDGSYVITVAAPHQYREVTVNADPEMLAERDVRLVTLTFRSSLFGKVQSRPVTLMTSGAGSLSQIIKYAHLPGDYEYDYDIVWRIRGGETVSSGPLKGADSMIFADELP